MEIKVNQKIIQELCGIVSFKKGTTYYRSNKVTFSQYRPHFSEATVHGAEDFHVTISKNTAGEIDRRCSCPSLGNFQKDCQHIAAVLIAIREFQKQKISPFGQPQQQSEEGELTDRFMTLFGEKNVQTSGQQHYFENREVLDLQFTCRSAAVETGQDLLEMEIKLNGRNLPHIRDFLNDVKRGLPHLLSDHFTYDPVLHCFSNEADEIIHQLIQVMDDERIFLESSSSSYTTSRHSLLIPPSSWMRLVPLLTKHPLIKLEQGGRSYESVRVVKGTPPLRFKLEENGESDARLTIKGFDQMLVLHAYRSVWCDGKVFQLEGEDSERLFALQQMLPADEMNHVPIPHDRIQDFLEKIVPGLKKIGHVQLSNAFYQKYLKTPLKAKLYLDRLKNRLLAGLEFHYGNVVIQPLENRELPAGPIVIRDIDKEEEILQLMEDSGFSKTDGGYYMQNDALEYEFLYHIVPKLQQMVQLYATTAVRNRIIRKNAHPIIKVKLNKKERTNWLEFKFEMDGISDQQMKDLLAAIEEKRKYYRLRNGNLLSLETREIEEIQRFLNEVPGQEEDLEASLHLPVEKSFPLLDKADESKVFSVEESFREFLNQVNHPGSIDFKVPESLEQILREYQKHGYKWMKMLASYGFGGVLADDMGLGKTLQSISFIVSELAEIREQKQPVLIVCPSSLTHNWFQEIAKFSPEVKAVILDGNKSDRTRLQKNSQKEDVLITSYPLLRRDIRWYQKQTFHTVFFDEAQAFKNPVTQTARAVKKLTAKHRFGLTGTPIENAVEELWSIYHVIFPQLLQGLQEYSFLPRKIIARRVRPFLLRRKKEDVLKELPKKRESLERSELLPEQKELYGAYLAKLREDTLKHLDQDTIRKNRIRILAGLTRLRQICCHPSLFVDGYQGSSAKFQQLLHILEESKRAGRRVLIFSQFTKMLKLIGRELAMQGQTYFYLDGETPSEERVELCHRFNQGEKDIFLISLKAGGTGLNLTGADTVILYDLWWNPAVEQQAADRTHRIGQNKTVQVIKLVARGTIEEKMNELQAKKRTLITELIDPEKQISTTLTEEDIREILLD
ncbi:SNF2 helicase associated domain-containing protein [Halobacillus rhizosphaerae]|uniref:DEAD/DEAH box helicase n=1 Tax=Halobacillus rhizosphaerae TaxID=3064889 RepID=UPI00398BAF10